MSTAIERITGFACEVNEEQWRELVKVADEVGCGIDKFSRITGTTGTNAAFKWNYAIVVFGGSDIMTYDKIGCRTPIPYPDFLAKLKGVEKWEPKNGERVEVSGNNQNWHERIFIVTHANMYYCVDANDQTSLFPWKHIRPLRHTITRKEAEEKLKARIID